MRLDRAILAFSLLGSAAASAIDTNQIPRAQIEQREPITPDHKDHELYKRRGGGGGGGRGGGGGGSSGGKSGSSSGSSGSSGSKGGSSSSGSKNTGKTSNTGGTSSGGSGPAPSYGGGKYYGGGASTPYRSGSRSPGGIAPFFLIGGALAFWPGPWAYGAHVYPYGNHDSNDPYVFKYHNVTTDKDEQRDVICGCGNYAECGCDKNTNDDYLKELVGNGSYAALNKSVINVAKVNGTMTLLINGTLPNGTTIADQDSGATDSMRSIAQALGFWPAIAAVTAAVFLA